VAKREDLRGATLKLPPTDSRPVRRGAAVIDGAAIDLIRIDGDGPDVEVAVVEGRRLLAGMVPIRPATPSASMVGWKSERKSWSVLAKKSMPSASIV
jgi:hypothetical protein